MAVLGVSGSYDNYSVYQAIRNQNVEKDKKESSEDKITNDSVTKETNLTKKNSQFKSVSDYSSYLSKNYSYFGKSALVNGVPTTVNVSGAFLSKCMEDSEKAKYLESNLKAISDSIAYVKSHSLGTLVNAEYKIDADGNISMMTVSTNDPDGKIAKENKEKAAKEQSEAEEKVKERREKHKEMLERQGEKTKDVNHSFAYNDILTDIGNNVNFYS